MFTGIIEELGEVSALAVDGDSARLTVTGTRTVSAAMSEGASLAVNGCCLTATSIEQDRLTADLMAETLQRTSLGDLRPGDPVNLERAVQVTGRLDGHIVQGHVDGTGTILERRHEPRWDLLRVSVPQDLLRYVAVKGSVAVDGVSLTVVDVEDPRPGAGSTPVPAGGGSHTVSHNPETLARTTLGSKEAGERVNLEVDVVAKYVERLLTAGEESAR